MFRKILIAASCVAVFGGANGMDTQEELVDNPIPKIVKYYGAITPEATIDGFHASVIKLLADLAKPEVREMYLNDDILKEKWQIGTQILQKVKEFSVVSAERSSLYVLFNEVTDITDNGFYDISRIILSIDEKKTQLRPVFNGFWIALLQAKEIVSWWMYSTPQIELKEIPSACFEAQRLVQNQDNEAVNVLFAISLVEDYPEAVEQLDPEGFPSEKKVVKAKARAKDLLQSLYSNIPGLNAVVKIIDKDAG
jgi:hypothetical protein